MGRLTAMDRCRGRGEEMAFGFPLYIDLNGNNCVVLGGGDYAADKVDALLKFGAKVTVISPTLCDRLRELDQTRAIRYIPRRYYRGDCTNAYICVAATGVESVNIAISDECKAKGVPVNVSRPAAFGNYTFPRIVLYKDVSLAVSGSARPNSWPACGTCWSSGFPACWRSWTKRSPRTLSPPKRGRIKTKRPF